MAGRTGAKKKRVVRVGMIKAVPEKWNKRRNWRTLERLTREAARRGADVVITPECFLDGYVIHELECTPVTLRRMAERGEKGAYVRRMKALAAELGVYLVSGFTDTPDGKTFLNAAYLFDRCGRVAGRYHKIHVYGIYTPGDALPVFDLEFGRVGMLICADRRWPENTRILALKGAGIILMPTYGMRHQANEHWMQTRAYENGIYICFAHAGVSFICNPAGELEAKLLSNAEDVLVHDIDLDAVTHKHLDERRPDLYGALVETKRKRRR